MATSQYRKGSANKMSNKQAVHHHDDETKMKTNHNLLRRSHVATWLFRFIKQPLIDYQNGRITRKRITQEPEPGAGDDRRWEPEDKTNKQPNSHGIPASATRGLSHRNPHGNPPQGNEQQRGARSAYAENWLHQAGEWPWRIEGVLGRDPSNNWRVLSVLEVKDWIFREMTKEHIVVPQTQRPSPHQEISENEVDELMDYLTRP